MKKLICFLLIGMMIISVAACAKKPFDNVSNTEESGKKPYSILVENGEYLLSFNNEYTSSDESVNNADFTSALVSIVKFGTIQEMISDIKTGNFTAEELGEISKFAKDENGRVFICNLSNMYTASCPSDMEMTSVTWYGGDAYCFYLSADGDQTIMLHLAPSWNSGSLMAAIIRNGYSNGRGMVIILLSQLEVERL